VRMAKPRLQSLAVGTGDGTRAVQPSRRVFLDPVHGEVDCPIYAREKLGAGDRFCGPAIVEEWDSTTVVLRGQSLEVDRYGNLIIGVG
jgi:N-methylhydantoinase A